MAATTEATLAVTMNGTSGSNEKNGRRSINERNDSNGEGSARRASGGSGEGSTWLHSDDSGEGSTARTISSAQFGVGEDQGIY